MMNKERFRNDPRIKPFIDKLNSQLGKKQCKYTMSGEIALRSCDRLYKCESCDFHQTIEDEVDRQLTIRAVRQKRQKARRVGKQTWRHEPVQSDN
jgi:hypothetical protein